MSTERGEGRPGRHAVDPSPDARPEPDASGAYDPYAPVSYAPAPREPERAGPTFTGPPPTGSTFPGPMFTGPIPTAPPAEAQLVPASDLPDLPDLPRPRPGPDDAARRRRRADEAVLALQVSESRLTDQIRAARAAGRTDGMRELLSRRLAVRARLEEARAR